VLPLYVPVLILGAGAVDGAAAGLDVSAHLLLMGALLVFALVFSLWPVAAALRVALE
jgi:heme exporter protein B